MLIPLIAFAGLTCSFAVRPIGLWSMDDYLWHLMNSVPLLHVTDALNWAEPKTHAGTILSLLLVIYQIAVILPFLGLGVAAVRVVSKNLPNVAKYWRELGGDEDRPPLAVSLILIGGSAVFWYISILILGLTVPSDSPLQRYLDRRLAEHMHILSHSVSLHWLHETIQVGVAVLLLIGGLALATITLAVESLLPLETVWSKARAFVCGRSGACGFDVGNARIFVCRRRCLAFGTRSAIASAFSFLCQCRVVARCSYASRYRLA